MKKGMSTLKGIGLKAIGVALISFMSSISYAQIWVDSAGVAVDDSQGGRVGTFSGTILGIDAGMMNPMNAVMKKVSQDLSNLFGNNRSIKANCSAPGINYYGERYNKSWGDRAGIHNITSWFGTFNIEPSIGSLLEVGDNVGNTIYTSSSFRKTTTYQNSNCYDPIFCGTSSSTNSIGVFSNSAPSLSEAGIVTYTTGQTDVEIIINLDTGYGITSTVEDSVTGVTDNTFQTNTFSGFEAPLILDRATAYNKGIFMPIKLGSKFYKYKQSIPGFTSLYGKGIISNTFDLISVDHLMSNGRYSDQIRLTVDLAKMKDGSKFQSGYVTHIPSPVFRVTSGSGGVVSASQGLIYNGQKTISSIERYGLSESHKNEPSGGLKTMNCKLKSI
jgi:hypothetical protein